jgi:hypothetical protein
VTGACLWCDNSFEQRTDGGKAQRFYRPACRRAFETASRRFVAEAIVRGMLTVDALRNASVGTPALLPATMSPAPVPEGPKPAEATPAAPEGLADTASNSMQ